MSLLRTAVRAIGAALALGAIAFMVPIGLWTLGRPLLPDTFPSWSQVTDALSRPDDGRLLLGLLVVVGAVAWLMLAFSIMAEVASVVTRRPVLRIELPGFRVSRAVAAGLIAALIGLGATPAIAQPAAASTTSWITPLADAPLAAGTEAGPAYVVQARDTLWGIAERELGNPLRWREIFDLNAGHAQPDGERLTEASLLRPGWELTLPTRDLPHQVRVVHGDTLSEIATEHLGSPAQTSALFDANVHAMQSDGAALTDPDLIQPGWILTLPEFALPVPDTTAPPKKQPPPLVPTQGPTAPPSVAQPPRSSEPSHSPATPPPRTAAPNPATTPPSSPRPIAVPDEQPSDSAVMPITIAASSLVISGMIGALAIRRRRQLRTRPHAHRIAVPSDHDGRIEWISRHREPEPLDIAYLDLALRSLTLTDWTGIEPPPLRSVRFTPAEAVLALARRASLPGPFRAAGSGSDWILEPGSDLSLDADEAQGCCPPFPLLVSVASTGGSQGDPATLMVDLEQFGMINIAGEEERARGLLRHIAAELANARWADDVEILVIGLGGELAALNPERLRILPDLDAGLAAVQTHIRRIRANLDRLPVQSVLGGRLSDVASDAWLPLVVLSADPPTDDQLIKLRSVADELESNGRSGVAVLTVGTGPGEPFVIGTDGTLAVAGIDGDPWHVEMLDEDTGTALASLLATASEPAVPVGPASGEQAWTIDMREDGSIDVSAADTAPRDTAAADTTPPPSHDMAEMPPAATDPEATRRMEIAHAQDPDLDADLERWWADEPRLPLIAILGQPSVRAPGTLPTTRLNWFTEILVYLCLHPAGVTTSKAQTDLWPDGHKISEATIRHAFYGARRWAGRGLEGDPERSFVSDMQNDSTYRIRGHLLDWDLFRRLRKRAQARHAAGHPGAVADYQTALELIRGPVLSSLRPKSYAWLNNHDQRHDLQIPGPLVDAAHELVDIALAQGDTVLARTAAEIARSVDIDVVFDRPLIDLMRIAHAEDSQSEMERYAAVLLDARGLEVPEDLEPETFAVLNELLPSGPRRSRP